MRRLTLIIGLVLMFAPVADAASPFGPLPDFGPTPFGTRWPSRRDKVKKVCGKEHTMEGSLLYWERRSFKICIY